MLLFVLHILRPKCRNKKKVTSNTTVYFTLNSVSNNFFQLLKKEVKKIRFFTSEKIFYVINLEKKILTILLLSFLIY